MENRRKRSKALIITIIVVVLLLIVVGILFFLNRNNTRVEGTSGIAKIFSSLTTSKNATKTSVQALEDIEKGSDVSIVGTGTNGVPLVHTAQTGETVYGVATEGIENGSTGEIKVSGSDFNTFWNSFSKFLGDMFKADKTITGKTCANGADNYPECTTVNGACLNGMNNPPECTTLNVEEETCDNGAVNPLLCTINSDGGCLNGNTNPPLCTTNSDGACSNGADNPTLCTVKNGSCLNGATNPPECTTAANNTCINGADNYPMCTTVGGVCLNGTNNPPLCTTVIDTNDTTTTTDDTTTCLNGANNPPLCTTVIDTNGTTTTTDDTISCLNGATNPPECTTAANNTCINGADNYPMCTTIGGVCLNGTNNPPLCTTNTNGTCLNGATNPPQCTTINGACLNGMSNPPLCTTNTNGTCLNGATNPPQCTTIGGACMNGAVNPPDCTEGADTGYPDLRAGTVTPISTTINTKTTLSSIITNGGGSSTKNSFSSFFSITSTKTSSETIELNTTVPTLLAGNSGSAQISYTFTTAGEYFIRVCADKSSSSDTGTITESNEDNNCGSYITLTVSDSLPSPDILMQCSDGLDNDGDSFIDSLDANCHLDGDLNNDYVPTNDSESNSPTTLYQCNDTVDNDGDGYIDSLDPNCHYDGNLNNDYVPTNDSESNSPTIASINICLGIEQNPLTFTEKEKADLAELLRKFYLVAPTLKTEEDIRLTYNEVTQQQNFSNQLDTLIKECYEQTASSSYTGPKTRYGNPWFKYTTRGTYVNSLASTGACYGTKSSDGRYCNTLTKSSCMDATNCYWMDMKDYEKILNVW